MRVLIIPSWYPDKKNTVSGIFFKEQAEALNEHVEVAILNLNKLTLKKPKNIFIKKRNELVYNNNLLTLNIDYVNWFPKLYFLSSKLYKYRLLNNYKKIISEFGKPDIIHAHVSYPGGYGAMILSEKLNIPFVVTEHASFFSTYLLKNYKNEVEKVLRNANIYTTVSSFLKKKIIESGRKQCKIIPNFINTQKFEKNNGSKQWKYKNKFNIVSITNMKEIKGLTYLLKSIKKVIEKHNKNNIHLHLIGDGPRKKIYMKLIKDLNIEEYCSFYGMMTNDEVAYFLNECDLLVISSKIETFSIVGIEAMASGLPVVSTMCGGPEDYVTPETGILVEKENVDSLTNGIINIINNYENYDSDYIKNYVKNNFSKEVVTKKYIKLYQKTIT